MIKDTEKMTSALKQIDDLTNATPPTIQMLTQKLKIHQEQKRVAFVKELILFICVACSIFVGGILLTLQAPINIIIIQVLGFIALPFIFMRDKKKIESEW